MGIGERSHSSASWTSTRPSEQNETHLRKCSHSGGKLSGVPQRERSGEPGLLVDGVLGGVIFRQLFMVVVRWSTRYRLSVEVGAREHLSSRSGLMGYGREPACVDAENER